MLTTGSETRRLYAGRLGVYLHSRDLATSVPGAILVYLVLLRGLVKVDTIRLPADAGTRGARMQVISIPVSLYILDVAVT